MFDIYGYSRLILKFLFSEYFIFEFIQGDRALRSYRHSLYFPALTGLPSVYTFLFTLIAKSGQNDSHIPQPEQISGFTTLTLPNSSTEMAPLAHTLTQRLHPLHQALIISKDPEEISVTWPCNILNTPFKYLIGKKLEDQQWLLKPAIRH